MVRRRETAPRETGLLAGLVLILLAVSGGIAGWAANAVWEHDALAILSVGLGAFTGVLTAVYIGVVRRNGGLSPRFSWIARAVAVVGVIEAVRAVLPPGGVSSTLLAGALALCSLLLLGTLLPSGCCGFLERYGMPVSILAAVLFALVALGFPAAASVAERALLGIGGAGVLTWVLAITWKPWPEFDRHHRTLALFGVFFLLSVAAYHGAPYGSGVWWFGLTVRLAAYSALLVFVFRHLAGTYGIAVQADGSGGVATHEAEGTSTSRPAEVSSVDALEGTIGDPFAVTETARVREALQKANAELDQFAYIASHDLKAPLRAIESLAKWIQDDAGDVLPPDSKRHLKTLLERIGRMRGLLADLLAYSRSGREKGAITVVSSVQIAREMVKLVGPPPGIAVEIATDMPELETFSASLETVFQNLISNAVKHMNRDSGRICISAIQVGDFVEFVVEDDGPGIPVDCRQRIFEVFQTLRPRDEVEGSGMGLAIVRKIVETEGGRVRAEESVLGGARLVFSWPVRSRCERETDDPGSLHSAGGR